MMGNRYHIPEITKQHVFDHTTRFQQAAVAKTFGVSTRTVERVVKNVRDYGRVCNKPLVAGRRRELSWGDTVVSPPFSPIPRV